jgi:hypothetical protein
VGWKRGYFYSRGGRYVGSGVVAVLAEALDDEERVQAIWERDQNREARQAELAKFQEVRERAARVDALVKAGLEAAGYHRARRHQWRRRRRTMETRIQSQAVTTATFELAELVQFSYVGKISGNSRETREGLEAKLAALRTRLAGPDPSPALELATAAAVHAWLDHWTVEMVAAHEPGKINLTLERRRTWSQRRLLQAVQTVEKVRRLARPRGPKYAVQIVNNPGPQQGRAAAEPCLAIVQ